MAADRLIRFVAYGLLGWCAEVAWTASLAALQTGDPRLAGTTYLWMFPIYGSVAFLYEPVHDAIRQAPWWGRAALWSLGITGVELASGWAIARATGACPWDYEAAGARFAINPYVRWDYFPVWAAFGLALEPVHDFLVRLTPALREAFVAHR